jgi:hypothetical protein
VLAEQSRREVAVRGKGALHRMSRANGATSPELRLRVVAVKTRSKSGQNAALSQMVWLSLGISGGQSAEHLRISAQRLRSVPVVARMGSKTGFGDLGASLLSAALL